MESAVQVRVPATSANLGPGFDALGLALGLYNRIELSRSAGPLRIEVEGEGRGMLEEDERNLGFRAVCRLYREVGETPPPLRIRLENRIPVSRGLGSSSSAIVGGLVGANALLGDPLNRERLLALAVELEGHPDNVAPALFGGFQVSAVTGDGLLRIGLPPPPDLRAVVCIPETVVSTAEARAALPTACPREDAVFNVGRAALLVASLLTGRTDVLRAAMEDRLHQPYRAGLVPGFHAAIRAAHDAGAAGACLSGSGSSLLALAGRDHAAIGEAMAAAVRAAGAEARWMALDLDAEGAVVVG